MRRLLAVVAVAVLVAGCGGGDGGPDVAPRDAAPTDGAPPAEPGSTVAGPGLGDVVLELVEVGRFDQPLAMTWCLGGDEPYVAEKGGRVRTLSGDTVLDLSDRVSSGSEQGLLGVACAPDGTQLYASYTDRAGTSHVERFARTASGSIDGGRRRTILEVPQPAANHNGGNLVVGPDGQLWLGLGDGGGADDRFDNAQDPDEVLGSLLVLDPAGGPPTIVAKGLRNPWRFSFDRTTGDLWIGDVGQGSREEVDLLPADGIVGANLGWPALEGTRRHRRDVEVPPDAVPPVFEYGRDDGQAVVGGHVYRGSAIAGLQGAYLFTDTYVPTLRAIVVEDGEVVAERSFGDVPGGLVSSFAEDPAGELYVLSLAGGVHRLDPA